MSIDDKFVASESYRKHTRVERVRGEKKDFEATD